MKQIIILVALSFVLTFSYAQEDLFAVLQTEKKVKLFDPSHEKETNSEKRFVFKVYGDNGSPKGEVEPHYLGNEIAEKWTIVNELYVRKTDVSIGFGSSYSETFKPSILNAVYRLNTYYKKALSRKTISEDEAKKQFSWILDCAIAICYCSDSADFELALAKAKETDQIVELFYMVEIAQK
ncbi:MAG: hypothetical protein GZ094_11635 [Mariniphaga sp.]|nr:hypothetical protein [Mariniphaga sp.]